MTLLSKKSLLASVAVATLTLGTYSIANASFPATTDDDERFPLSDNASGKDRFPYTNASSEDRFPYTNAASEDRFPYTSVSREDRFPYTNAASKKPRFP